MGIINKEKKEFLNIFNILKKRNFKGNKGLAVKNSMFQISQTFLSKIGGFIFIVLLARFLLPELFGLFSLVTSTIFIFVSFSELGLGSALIRYVSKNINKNKLKAEEYASFLFKLKIVLVFSLFVIFIISAKFIADYYGKPIFLALIAGSIYFVFFSFVNFFEYLFYSLNKFKEPLIKEVVFQICRLVLFFLVLILLIKFSFSIEISLVLIIISLSLASFFTLLFMLILAKKNLSFLKTKKRELTREEKTDLKKFTFPLSVMILSGVFLGNIDIIMLGKFVSAEFIGNYNAAFKLIIAISSLTTFSIVLLPIFSNLKGERLEKGFKKAMRAVSLLSFGIFLIVFLFAPLIIKIIFGENYLDSVPILRVLSFILISAPLSKIYTSYFTSQGDSKTLAKILISTTILNIILNYILITSLLNYGQNMAILGAAIATIFSRYVVLFCLYFSKKLRKIDTKKKI